MRIPLLLALGLCAACATPAATTAPSTASAPAPKAHHGPATGPLVRNGDAVLGDSTTCPVSGETFVIDADTPKAEYDGKTYYFCCPDCQGDFQRDPAKFASKIP